MKKILFILICFIILGQSATSFSEEGRIYLPNAYKEDWVIDQETNWINPNLYFATISNISSKELRLIAGIPCARGRVHINVANLLVAGGNGHRADLGIGRTNGGVCVGMRRPLRGKQHLIAGFLAVQHKVGRNLVAA